MTLPAFGQEYEVRQDEIYRSSIRKILNKFSITLTTGYNSTQYTSSLTGFEYIQSGTEQWVSTYGAALRYDHWFNDPRASGRLPPSPSSSSRIYTADRLGLNFVGHGWGVPLNLSLRYNLGRFRLGGGLSLEAHTIKTLRPTVTDQGIRDYVPNFSSALFTSYYVQLGCRVYDFWDYSLAAEIEIGRVNMGKRFNPQWVKPSGLVNVGVAIEKNLSEYARIILKPSFDFKSYQVRLPKTSAIIHFQNPTFRLNLGISITFPEIPRSPMRSDAIQLKHVLYDPKKGRYFEVRGQSIWKRQNPKVGENYQCPWVYPGWKKP